LAEVLLGKDQRVVGIGRGQASSVLKALPLREEQLKDEAEVLIREDEAVDLQLLVLLHYAGEEVSAVLDLEPALFWFNLLARARDRLAQRRLLLDLLLARRDLVIEEQVGTTLHSLLREIASTSALRLALAERLARDMRRIEE